MEVDDDDVETRGREAFEVLDAPFGVEALLPLDCCLAAESFCCDERGSLETLYMSKFFRLDKKKWFDIYQ